MKSISFLAAVTVTLFTLAAVHNNDVFWGDTVLLSAVRVDDETWQLFFARFDFSVVVSLGLVFVRWGPLLVLPETAMDDLIKKLRGKKMARAGAKRLGKETAETIERLSFQPDPARAP